MNEVPTPIICNPYEEPLKHWHIVEGEPLTERMGRRESHYFYRPAGATPTAQTGDAGTPVKLELVNELRARVKRWRDDGYPGVTRTTLDLLKWWRRDGRLSRFFFAQLEAVETVVFLTEARQDYRQGIQVPRDDPSTDRIERGYTGFTRYACKMATGTGKTTVMGMLAAWSILNKRANRQDARFSDVVLVVCPNVTIRDRLNELYPERGDASIYRTRDIVPEPLMAQLRQGHVIVTNWHRFEPRDVSGPNRVDRRGKQSDTALIKDVLRGVQRTNVLVLNDEAHHAYRVIPKSDDTQLMLIDDEDDPAAWRKEATVWIDGLDKLNRIRGINVCVDLSATPYYLDRVGQDANTPFPWVVSDFSLVDAIESGLVKIPQLAIRDTTGAAQPAYFNIWKWILPQLTAAERGGRRAVPKPEAILKYAHTPITILAGEYREVAEQWESDGTPTPPVFIIVCKNTRLAQTIFEWISGAATPPGIPAANQPLFANTADRINTIRVDSKVIEETDQEGSKDDNKRWMRFTLDTVGRTAWPVDSQGRVLYPEGFEDLAAKLQRPLSPPGRDVRCIISVGMLTEGWDCRTVTHILGLRPFESQLLCEQVVGRGLRRSSYDVDPETNLMTEEVADVLGVPFEIIPFKKTGARGSKPKTPRHVRALDERKQYEITFPRVDGYTSAPKARITVNWDQLPIAALQPDQIPPEVELKALVPNNRGRPSLSGPGRISHVDLEAWRSHQRVQRLEFELAATLTRELALAGQVPAHALFGQLQPIVSRFLREKVRAMPGTDVKDIFLSPYYGWAIERLAQAVRPAESEAPEVPRYESHRGPGSSADVDYWTTKPETRLREAIKTHINYVVADTERWEQEAAYYLDQHENVDAFVKNAGLGFAVPYLHNGEQHDFEVDYIVRLKVDGQIVGHLLLEPKGHDPRAEVKGAAAKRWCDAVTAEGSYGPWTFAMIRESMSKIPGVVSAAAAALAEQQ